MSGNLEIIATIFASEDYCNNLTTNLMVVKACLFAHSSGGQKSKIKDWACCKALEDIPLPTSSRFCLVAALLQFMPLSLYMAFTSFSMYLSVICHLIGTLTGLRVHTD